MNGQKSVPIAVHWRHKRKGFIRTRDNAIDVDHVVANSRITARSKD